MTPIPNKVNKYPNIKKGRFLKYQASINAPHNPKRICSYNATMRNLYYVSRSAKQNTSDIYRWLFKNYRAKLHKKSSVSSSGHDPLPRYGLSNTAILINTGNSKLRFIPDF